MVLELVYLAFLSCAGALCFPVTADASFLLYWKAFGRPASSYSLSCAPEHEATEVRFLFHAGVQAGAFGRRATMLM